MTFFQFTRTQITTLRENRSESNNNFRGIIGV